MSAVLSRGGGGVSHWDPRPTPFPGTSYFSSVTPRFPLVTMILQNKNYSNIIKLIYHMVLSMQPSGYHTLRPSLEPSIRSFPMLIYGAYYIIHSRKPAMGMYCKWECYARFLRPQEGTYFQNSSQQHPCWEHIWREGLGVGSCGGILKTLVV